MTKENERKSTNGKNVTGKREKSGSNSNRIITAGILVSTLSIVAFKVHQALTTIPPLPDLDENFQWGNGCSDESIRPYRVVFSDAMQAELRTRFDLHRKRDVKSFDDVGWTYGIHSDAVTAAVNHWRYKYPFRERERYLNKYTHYKTCIQGLDVHFVRVMPDVPQNVKVYPILLLHGWPSSFRDFFEVIPTLTTKQEGHDFVFDVIVPSLPGFGYSQGASKPGLSPATAAVVIRNLMRRIGHRSYYIHGGDFGHAIGSALATLYPTEVLGFHTILLSDFSTSSYVIAFLGALFPRLVVEKQFEDRLYPLGHKAQYVMEEFGYMHLQGTKPDTVGVALNDSPVGLAAYILDRFMMFTNPGFKNSTNGGLSYYNMNDLLDNIMIFWTSGCITTSMRMYKESFANFDLEMTIINIPTRVPVWGLRPRHELFFQPTWLLGRKYPNLLGVTDLPDGGHFLAFEKPIELANDVFKAVERMRAFEMPEK